MKVSPRHLGCLAKGFLAWGALNAIAALAFAETVEGRLGLVGSLLWIAAGGVMMRSHRRMLSPPKATPAAAAVPAAEAVPAASAAPAERACPASAEVRRVPVSMGRPPFGLALVIGESEESPFFGQLAAKLASAVAHAPHYALAPDATVERLTCASLPDETRSACQGFVWTLQQKFGRRGGAWEVDSHEVMGVPFVVVYLE